MSAIREFASVSAEPLGLLGLTMLVALAINWPRRDTALWRYLAITTLMFFFAGSPYVANFLIGRLEDSARKLAVCPRPQPNSILLVLAGGIDGLPGTADTYERLKDASFRRTVAAVRLAQSSPDTTLLFSGGSGEEVREADVMSNLALELGIPRKRVLIERESRNTFDNARNSRLILNKSGLTGQVYLITSAIHMARAEATFSSAGWKVCPYPVDFRKIHVEGLAALVPQASALNKNTEVIHELLGYLAYDLSGRI